MTYVEKNGVVMAARDEHQLAAFINNGWLLKENKAEEKPVEKPIEEVPAEEPKAYTKSAIMRMPAADLRGLAEENGLDDADGYTAAELKEWLIDKLGL